MPQIVRAIQDTDLTIIRPVAKAVIRQMCEGIGIPPNIDILFPAGEGVVEQAGSTVEAADNSIKLTNHPHIVITVENKAGFGGLYYDTRHKSESKPIFVDQKLGMYLAPSISNRELNITVKYTARDKITVDQWYQSMRSRVLDGRLQILHRAEASFIMPLDPLRIMHHVHSLREKVAGYGEEWGHYFKEHADNRFTMKTDQAGNNKALAFILNYAEFYGVFDNQTEAEKGERDDKTESWTSTFNYVVQLDVVTDVVLRYPIVVHNQYIDTKYLYDIKPTNYDELRVDGTQATMLDAFFGVKRPAIPAPLSYGIRMPKHDDWLVPGATFSPHTSALYTVLLSISEDNPQYFMNLQDVPALDMPDFVWEYIKKESKWLTVVAECLFQLEVYLQDDNYPSEAVVVTPELDVSVKPVVNLRYQHHVRLGIYTDLKYLSEEARKRLQDHGRVLDWWIKKYRPDIKWTKDRAIGENNDYVSDHDINIIVGLTGQKPMDTVESFGSRVYRRNNY